MFRFNYSIRIERTPRLTILHCLGKTFKFSQVILEKFSSNKTDYIRGRYRNLDVYLKADENGLQIIDTKTFVHRNSPALNTKTNLFYSDDSKKITFYKEENLELVKIKEIELTKINFVFENGYVKWICILKDKTIQLFTETFEYVTEFKINFISDNKNLQSFYLEKIKDMYIFKYAIISDGFSKQRDSGKILLDSSFKEVLNVSSVSESDGILFIQVDNFPAKLYMFKNSLYFIGNVYYINDSFNYFSNDIVSKESKNFKSIKEFVKYISPLIALSTFEGLKNYIARNIIEVDWVSNEV